MRNKILEWFSHLRHTRVIALVGKSGTGKSFRAQLLVDKFNVDILIDDGLIIKDQKILTGNSAKKEATYLAAVRAALFENLQHRKDACAVLRAEKPRNILILGTSEKMIFLICKKLDLPTPAKIVTIEHISTSEEIRKALSQRRDFGKHVIPIPALKVKQRYPRLIVESVSVFIKKKLRLFRENQSYEKALVQPIFSSGSTISISETALQQMLVYCVAEFDAAITLNKTQFKKRRDGIEVDLYVEVPYRFESSNALFNLRQYILSNITKYSQVSLKELNIIISKVRK